MSDPQKTKSPKGEKSPKRDKQAEGEAGSRSPSMRIERSLKEVDRLLQKNPEAPPHQRAMAQLAQAKILALLQVAHAIRDSKKG